MVLIGVVAFLNNTGVIVAEMNWSTVWPLIVIIAGMWVKHGMRCKMCGMGGATGGCCKGGVCEHGSEHKCEGGKCGH